MKQRIIQRDLFAQGEVPFWQQIEQRLPKGEVSLLVSDVAIVFGVSTKLVYAWMEEGRVYGINYGSRRKPYWRITVASIRAHAKRMSDGL